MTLAILADKNYKQQAFLFLKRSSDMLFSFLGLTALSPFLLIVAICIKATSKGPIFFSQKRVGYDGKVFHLFKFRSMSVDAESQLSSLAKQNERDGPVFKMADDPRVTFVGRFIRKHSIDELPQLFNILKGEMSLVGPRPNTIEEVTQYKKWHHKRLQVQPGLTCYWQVHPDRNMSFDNWVRLDLKYIDDRSTLTDIKLILKTIPIIFTGH